MFKIVTDSTADLPVEYLKEHDLGCMNLSYIMDGVTYGQGQELPEKEFYALMRQGKMPTTSQVNPEEAKAHFTEYLKENKEILCIAFSSGLSGTYNSMRIAADEIMEEQLDCKIIVIDSLCASLGEGRQRKGCRRSCAGSSCRRSGSCCPARRRSLCPGGTRGGR